MRAVLEGVTFALRDSLELMRRLGVDAEDAVAVGGGARSAVWRQMQADVLGVPVVTVAPSGGAPYGAAVLAAAGSGRFTSVEEACREWIRQLDRLEPSPAAAAAYGQAYERYRSLYPRLKRHFAEQAEAWSRLGEAERTLRPLSARNSGALWAITPCIPVSGTARPPKQARNPIDRSDAKKRTQKPLQKSTCSGCSNRCHRPARDTLSTHRRECRVFNHEVQELREGDRLRAENEALRSRITGLTEAILRISEDLDLDTVLQEVVDGARSLVGARYGAILTFDRLGECTGLHHLRRYPRRASVRKGGGPRVLGCSVT